MISIYVSRDITISKSHISMAGSMVPTAIKFPAI